MFKKFAKGLLFGTTVGGITALFLAPKSGVETRAEVTGQVNDSKQAVKTMSQSIKGVKTNMKKVQEELVHLDEVKKETNETIDKFKYEVTPRIKNINEQIEKIQQKLEK